MTRTVRRRAGACIGVALLLVGLAPAADATTSGGTTRAVADRCVIDVSHQIFLDRPATEAEVQSWSGRFAVGEGTHRLPQELATSDEWLAAVVSGLYRQALDREPDTAGRTYWTEQLRLGALVNRIASQIYGSAELQSRAGPTTDDYIRALYTRILHRPADTAGLAYWRGRVATFGHGPVAAAFFASVESRDDRVEDLYHRILGRAPDAAGRQYWIGQLATVNDVRLAVLLASSAELRAGACATAHLTEITRRAHQAVLGRRASPEEQGDWAGRLRTRPYHQWLVAELMATPEYRAGLGRMSTEDFLAQARVNVGGGLTDETEAQWAADLEGDTRSRLDLLVALVETVGPPLQPPDAPVPCAQFSGGGTVVPQCHTGGAGGTGDTIFVTVPGTITIVNIAGLPRMWAFLDAARRAGHAVDANGAYGSARTREQQEYLFTHGYPANPPGTSMHEWGLALDVACDGLGWSQTSPECRQWVVENAGTYGFRVHVEEAWHYSSNGRTGADKEPGPGGDLALR